MMGRRGFELDGFVEVGDGLVKDSDLEVAGDLGCDMLGRRSGSSRIASL